MKAETIAARIRQILKEQTETAILNAFLTLDKVDHPAQETALNDLLISAWNNELERAERWTFTQLLQRWLQRQQQEAREVPAAMSARFKAMWWLRHSAKDFLDRDLPRELLDLTLEERHLAVQFFAEGIPARPQADHAHLHQVHQEMVARTAQLQELELQINAQNPQAIDAWVKLLLARFEANGNYWAATVRAPSFQAQMADTLARELLDYDFSALSEKGAYDVKMVGLLNLSEAPMSEDVELRILREMVEDQNMPFAGFGVAHGVSHLLRKSTELLQAGRLPPLILAALRRSATYAYGSENLKYWFSLTTPELNPGEAWSDAFLARLDALSTSERAPWPALAAFARTATAGKPTAKWLKEAQKHVDAVGTTNFNTVLASAFPLLSRARTFPLQETGYYGGNPNLLIDNFNALTLKGLLWMVPLVANTALTRTLGGVVESALKKVPGVGPREPKIANAAVYALSQIDSEVALSTLARLSTTLTFKGTLKEVQKALGVVSERLKVSPDDLLDMGVPTLGFTGLGERVEVLGDTEARLGVDATGAHLSFTKGGKALKSVPVAVKKDFADELKELKAAQKEAEQALSALALRLDGLMIQPRTWLGESWLERYLNHPLAGTVARRLIWLVDGVAAFADGDELRDVNSQTVTVKPDSVIKLWHPIGRSVEEVLAWRSRLEALEIRQPFKQAWREVYVLTDAERRTNTYSNRFAGHILKQHQFNALAALRGWRNKLRLMVDDSYPPAMRDLPAYGLRAEYWIEGIGENYGEDCTETGTYLRVTTDQVRFYPLNAPENHAHAAGGGYTMWVNQAQQPLNPLSMEEIPPLVLSEILRDVDLFVGVASVGNDPTWQDGGPGGRFREYWQSYSFGELTETAKTRAEYLKRLIPRLKIKDRLELDGRFLKVRGDRRTYKIHLGSSNILMEPNDQYLCIIPGGKGDGLEVDFDGDRVLSLVLSKAFLLADDTKITDPVILQQLGWS